MNKLRAHRPSPALVIACLALFASLASGATAAKLLTGKQIAKKTITGKNVKPKTLTGKHVKDGSLAAKDFKKGVFSAGGAAGPQGASGPEGARGVDGAPGTDGGAGVPGAPGRDGEDGGVGAAGPRGEKGDQGDAGPVGPAGDNGAAGATSVVIRQGSDTNIQAAMTITVSANCNAGERATGGGGTNGGTAGVRLVQSYPIPAALAATPTGWAASYENASGGPAVVRTWVVCASP